MQALVVGLKPGFFASLRSSYATPFSAPSLAADAPLIERVLGPFQRFVATSAAGGIVLLVTTAVALVWANSGWADSYHHLSWPCSSSSSGSRSSAKFLSANWRRFARPHCLSRPRSAGCWCRRRSMRSSTAAGPARPDGGAYGDGHCLCAWHPRAPRRPAASGPALLVALFTLNRAGARRPLTYALPGVVLWVLMLESGVHATVGGVLLALTVPARTRISETPFLAAELAQARLQRMKHALHALVAFVFMPVFALANAGVALTGVPAALAVLSQISRPATARFHEFSQENPVSCRARKCYRKEVAKRGTAERITQRKRDQEKRRTWTSVFSFSLCLCVISST